MAKNCFNSCNGRLIGRGFLGTATLNLREGDTNPWVEFILENQLTRGGCPIDLYSSVQTHFTDVELRIITEGTVISRNERFIIQ